MDKNHEFVNKEMTDQGQSQGQKEDTTHKETMKSKTNGDTEKSLVTKLKRSKGS